MAKGRAKGRNAGALRSPDFTQCNQAGDRPHCCSEGKSREPCTEGCGWGGEEERQANNIRGTLGSYKNVSWSVSEMTLNAIDQPFCLRLRLKSHPIVKTN